MTRTPIPTARTSLTLRERRLLAGALAAVVALCVLLGVFAVQTREPSWAPLDAASPAPQGALALAAGAARLGWRAEQQRLPLARVDSAATYLAVRTDHGVREADAGRLLAAVRAGAGLVVDVRGPDDPLTDSLGLRLLRQGSWTLDNARTARRLDLVPALDRPNCRSTAEDLTAGTTFAAFALADSGPVAPGAPGRHLFVDARRTPGLGITPPGAPARDGVSVPDAAPVWSPLVVGFPLGRGRVVAVADASLLTNSAVRTCWAAAGPAAVRVLEWVAPPDARPGRGTVVFLQGRRPGADGAEQPSVLRAVWRALTEAPAGRALAAAVLAALVLLAARAPRALPPAPERRAERRSPLEHVGALAGAYREARATRLVARRLARGLRRRHGGAGADAARARGRLTQGGPAPNTSAGAGPPAGTSTGGRPDAAPPAGAPPVADDADAAFLAAVAARHPRAAPDAALLAAAARAPVAPAQLAEVGAAAARLDALLDAARRG